MVEFYSSFTGSRYININEKKRDCLNCSLLPHLGKEIGLSGLTVDMILCFKLNQHVYGESSWLIRE